MRPDANRSGASGAIRGAPLSSAERQNFRRKENYLDVARDDQPLRADGRRRSIETGGLERAAGAAADGRLGDP